jgi:peroxiredoxin (alkyl hydroperoxide reductase subunit C)
MEGCVSSLRDHNCFHLEEQAPDFCAPAFFRGQEIQVCLKNFSGKWLLLFFYSSDFTFV